MPNWLTHLRAAEMVKDNIDFSVNEEKYYMGSIATDCGEIQCYINGKALYNPPRYITHWTDNIDKWDAPIHFERFYNTYIKNENDLSKKSFYFGYYIHLMTDAIWIELVSRPVIESFASKDEYKKIAKNDFREDWFHTELAFLNNNPNYYPLELMKSINDFENIYLDYGSPNALKSHINWMAENYMISNSNKKIKYHYFSPKDYENVMSIIKKIITMNILSK